MNARLLLVCAAAALATACDLGGSAVVDSGFDENAEGWTVIGDAAAVEPEYRHEGGNPGGFICASDDATSGVWFYNAPDRYLGDQSAALGTTLRFDLTITSLDQPFDDVDVALDSGDVTLVFDTADNPADDGSFTSYSVPLSAHGWTVGDLEGDAATDDDLRAALAAVDALRIRGEFDTGPDTGCIDNVRLGAPTS